MKNIYVFLCDHAAVIKCDRTELFVPQPSELIWQNWKWQVCPWQDIVGPLLMLCTSTQYSTIIIISDKIMSGASSLQTSSSEWPDILNIQGQSQFWMTCLRQKAVPGNIPHCDVLWMRNKCCVDWFYGSQVESVSEHFEQQKLYLLCYRVEEEPSDFHIHHSFHHAILHFLHTFLGPPLCFHQRGVGAV